MKRSRECSNTGSFSFCLQIKIKIKLARDRANVEDLYLKDVGNFPYGTLLSTGLNPFN